MGLPAPLLRLADLEEELIEAVAMPPSATGEQAPIEVLAEQASKIEALLVKNGPTLDEMFADIERSARVVGPAGQTYLDEAIESLSAREAGLATKLLPMLQAARSLGKRVFRAKHLNREEKARHLLVLERQEKALSAVLRRLRDERWRLMTLRAEIGPAGDAPVFSDPGQLLEYLQADRK